MVKWDRVDPLVITDKAIKLAVDTVCFVINDEG